MKALFFSALALLLLAGCGDQFTQPNFSSFKVSWVKPSNNSIICGEAHVGVFTRTPSTLHDNRLHLFADFGEEEVHVHSTGVDDDEANVVVVSASGKKEYRGNLATLSPITIEADSFGVMVVIPGVCDTTTQQ
jgi:hypothetical protein